jgi:protein-L-isoaspartate(D-aspartate) O-methyltransferase
LDVGCGCGYFTVLSARVNPTSTVLGVDYIPQLVDLSRTNTEKEVNWSSYLNYLFQDSDLLVADRVRYVVANGWDLSGIKSDVSIPPEFQPPYDAIHVGAAAESIPESLLSALKVTKSSNI